MTTKIKLLPLPKWMGNYTIPADSSVFDKDVMLADRMRDYARANVAHAIAVKDAEIEALVEALRSILGWRELRSGNDFPVERIEEIARAALAARRKDGQPLYATPIAAQAAEIEDLRAEMGVLREALEYIRIALRRDPFVLLAELDNIRQIADAALEQKE